MQKPHPIITWIIVNHPNESTNITMLSNDIAIVFTIFENNLFFCFNSVYQTYQSTSMSLSFHRSMIDNVYNPQWA